MLSHIDENNMPRMVDVGAKDNSERVATASGIIRMSAEAFAAARTEAGFPTEEEYRTAVEGDWANPAFHKRVEERIKKHTDNYKGALEVLKQAETAAAGLTTPDMPALTAAETAAAFARLGRWLYARDPSLVNLAMLLSRTEEKTALSL